MTIGKNTFCIGKRTYIMSVLNITPDSFYDGFNYFNETDALRQAKKLVEEGADLVDIGFASTKPGLKPCDAKEELTRLNSIGAKVIKTLNEMCVPVSIDTFRPEVAEASLKIGANMINDVFGFKMDEKMAQVCAKYDARCCLMHNPIDHYTDKNLKLSKKDKEQEENSKDVNIILKRDASCENVNNFLNGVLSGLEESVDIAAKYGIKKENIIIDPGIGFKKSLSEDLEIIKNLKYFSSLGLPILAGASNKRVIGEVLDLAVDQRIEGTIAASVALISHGVDFLRVHNCLENKRAATFADKIFREL